MEKEFYDWRELEGMGVFMREKGNARDRDGGKGWGQEVRFGQHRQRWGEREGQILVGSGNGEEEEVIQIKR